MKLLKKLTPPTRSDRQWLVASLIIFIASAVIAILAINARNTPHPVSLITDINGNSFDAPAGTLVPGGAGASSLISQMTAIANAPPLTGPLADDVHALSQMVSSCPDYSQARRDQMNQHIAWLLQPSTLPKEIIIALGTNTNGRLFFGMATYTLSAWGEKQKAPDSCLIPIGKKLNDLLVANGEERFKEFDST
jgi:hypothetical protein